jgi:glycosyltransferase involved in cell wall biosynthesis
VITVCRNAVNEIGKTIESVINQSYAHIDYIVVDGGSTDGTLEVIRSAHTAISAWVSEADTGIYDAMNKGVRLAKGTWVVFMNAGDTFYSPDSLRQLISSAPDHCDILYGDHEVRYLTGHRRIQRAKPLVDLWKGMLCSHQAMISRTELLLEHPFDQSQSITADFAFLVRQHVRGRRVCKRDVVVASILAGGLSDIERTRAFKGYHAVVSRELPKSLKVTLYYAALAGISRIKHVVRTLLPVNVWERIAMLRHGGQ